MHRNRNQCCIVYPENHAPRVLNGDVTLEIQFGEIYLSLMTVQVQDADGDTVSFSVTSDSPPGLAVNSNSGTLSWINVPDMSLDATRKTVKVIVADGKVDVIWVPRVNFCKCEVRHMCNSNDRLFVMDELTCIRVVHVN